MVVRASWIVVACVAVAACRKHEDESLSAQAGSKVAETVTHFGKGVAAGIDRGGDVAVEVAPDLTAKAVSATVCKWGEDGQLAVYLIARDAGPLRVTVKAFDGQAREIGRSTADAVFAADDAQYVKFKFPAEMDKLRVTKYVVDLAK